MRDRLAKYFTITADDAIKLSLLWYTVGRGRCTNAESMYPSLRNLHDGDSNTAVKLLLTFPSTV